MSGIRCFFIPVQGSLEWMAGSVNQIAEPPVDPSKLHDVQRCAAEVSRAVPKSLQEALSAGEDTREGRRRLTKVEQKKILAPLLRLRQACCHPQARP